MEKFLLIITARAGSKGIPNKNMINVAGKPLLHYTLEIASKLVSDRVVDRAILSSDSEEMISFSKNYPNIFSLKRPSHLATDVSKSVDVIIHILDELNAIGEEWENVILLQPTSPLRTLQHVEEATEQFLSSNSESLISGYLDTEGIYNKLYYFDNNKGVALSNQHNEGNNRQSLRNTFVRNGAIYISKSRFILESKRVFSSNPLLYIMSKKDSIDLNDEEDLFILNKMFN